MPRLRVVRGLACPLEVKVAFKPPPAMLASRRVHANERVTICYPEKCIVSEDIASWCRWLCDNMDRLDQRMFYIELALALSVAEIETVIDLAPMGPRPALYEETYGNLLAVTIPWLQTDSGACFVASMASTITDAPRKVAEMHDALVAFAGPMLMETEVARAMVVASYASPRAQNHAGWSVLCEWARLFYERKDRPFLSSGAFLHSLVDNTEHPVLCMRDIFADRIVKWTLSGKVYAARRAHQRLYSRGAIVPIAELDRRRVDTVTRALLQAQGLPDDLSTFVRERPTLDRIDADNPVHVAWLAAMDILGVGKDGSLGIGRASAAVPLCAACIVNDDALFMSVPAFVVESVCASLYRALRHPGHQIVAQPCITDSILFAARVCYPLLCRVEDKHGICDSLTAVAVIRSVMTLPQHLLEMCVSAFASAEWTHPLLDRRMMRRVVARGLLARCMDDWRPYEDATEIPGAAGLSELELDMYVALLPTLLGSVFCSSAELVLFLDLSAERSVSEENMAVLRHDMEELARDMARADYYLRELPTSAWTAPMLLRFYCLVAETARRGRVDRAREYVLWMQAEDILIPEFDIYPSPTPLASLFPRLGVDGPKGLPPLVLPAPAMPFVNNIFPRIFAFMGTDSEPSQPYPVPADNWDGLDAL